MYNDSKFQLGLFFFSRKLDFHFWFSLNLLLIIKKEPCRLSSQTWQADMLLTGFPSINVQIYNKMTNNEEYLKCLEEIKGMDPKAVKRPSENVRGFLGKCQVYYTEGTKDIDKLKKAGLKEAVLESIKTYTKGLSTAEAHWLDVYKRKKDAMEEWSSNLDDSYELKEELLNDLSFAFRKEPGLLARVEMLREGNTHDDMIQDLKEIAITGRKHLDLLGAIGVSSDKLDQAEELYNKLFELKALATGEKNEVHPALLVRNQIYTLLADVVKELKEVVRYVFWRDTDNLNRYLMER